MHKDMPAMSQPEPTRIRSKLLSSSGLAWGLLAFWLLYSGAVLGWQLSSDPLLSAIICGTR
jgi:hypothetical protein